MGPAPHWNVLGLFADNLGNASHAVMVDRGRGRSRAGMDLELDERWQILPLNRMAPTGLGRLIESPAVERRLRQLVAGFDYCHIRLPSWVGLAAWRAATRRGTPYWVSLHADWARILESYEEGAPSGPARAYYRLARKRVEEALPRIIASARAVFLVASSLRDRWAADHPKTTLFNDTTHSSEEVGPFRETFRTEQITLLFVGEVSRAKGVEDLVAAARILASGGGSVNVVLVGKGPLLERLQALGAGPGVRIECRGWVPQGPRLDAEFRRADALVLPSWNEGTPRVIVEAFVRSTPVVGTDVGDVPVLLGRDERGWLVPAKAPEAIASAVRAMKGESEERARRVRAGLDFSRRFDRSYWTGVIRQGLRLVDPLVLSGERRLPGARG